MKTKIFLLIISIIIQNVCIDAEEPVCSNCKQSMSHSHTSHAKRGTSNSISDFGDLTRCTTFVDKTMMIEAFFNNTASGQFHLITTPHKFGRTINLNMLKRFVELTVNGRGDVLEKVESSTYSLFTNEVRKLNIGPFLVSENPLYENHFHSYPVIYVSFKDLVGNTYEGIVKSLRDNIRTCFQSYEWIYRKLVEEYKNAEDEFPTAMRNLNLMKKILNGQGDEEDIIDSLTEFAKTLFDFFDYKHVFVFIDDYDSPILNAIEHNLDVGRVHKLMEKIYSKLLNPDHRHIKYAVLSGTMNVLSKAKFSNVKHWNFLDDHDFVRYFGFLDNEVDQLLTAHGNPSNEQTLVKNYYGGYLSFHSLTGLYNPYSIVKYLCNREANKDRVILDNFWPEAGQVASSLQQFKKIKKYRDILLELLVAKAVKFSVWTRFSVDELIELKRMMHQQDLPLTDFHADLFLSYLFANGYLTYTDVQNVFALPSCEIQNYINQIFMKTPKRELANSGEIREKLGDERTIYKKIWDKLFGR